MYTFEFTTNGATLTLTKSAEITTNSSGVVQCQFIFDSSWDAYTTKTPTFYCGGKWHNGVMNPDGVTCDIQDDVIAYARIGVGVIGTNSTQTCRSTIAHIDLETGAEFGIEDGEDDSTLWEKYLAQFAAIQADVNESEANADTSEANAKTYADQALASANNAATSASSAASAVNTHNSATDAHSDIRSQIAFPATNLITNGDFSNGTTGWGIGYTGVSLDTSNGIGGGNCLKVLLNGTSAYPNMAFNTIIGHKYYLFGQVNITAFTSASSICLATASGAVSGVASGTKLNQWQFLSGIYTATGTSALLRLQVYLATLTCFWDKVGVIDLTATFGTGYEPTVSKMDSIMSYYSNSWFDGTVNLANYKWLISYILKQLG